ncbi:MAG: anthranilate phosphoribosyltransferase [Cyanobacteriota bacterium]
MSSVPAWPPLLEQLLQGRDLDGEQATALMEGWLSERIEPPLTGALLAAVLRRACPLPGSRPPLPLVDTCGTGGDGADSFNISTAVAFTAAACGAHVAKHGNRSASGRVGSADVLEALGIHLQAPQDQVIAALPEAGLTFLFAPGWHPALVGLAPLRRSIGVRTVFNLLGPLVNPLRPEAQVLGVARADLLDPMAEALARLGLKRAVVVHGHGGLDEASLSGPSALRLVENGSVRSEWLDPLSLGLEPAPLEALAGGDLAANRLLLEQVLRGAGTSAQRDVVALNTALVLWAAGLFDSPEAALSPALEALASGAAWQRLERLRQALPTPSAG